MWDKILATLSFYADARLYRFDQDQWADHDYPVMADKGEKARLLLADLKAAGDTDNSG